MLHMPVPVLSAEVICRRLLSTACTGTLLTQVGGINKVSAPVARAITQCLDAELIDYRYWW